MGTQSKDMEFGMEGLLSMEMPRHRKQVCIFQVGKKRRAAQRGGSKCTIG